MWLDRCQSPLGHYGVVSRTRGCAGIDPQINLGSSENKRWSCRKSMGRPRIYPAFKACHTIYSIHRVAPEPTTSIPLIRVVGQREVSLVDLVEGLPDSRPSTWQRSPNWSQPWTWMFPHITHQAPNSTSFLRQIESSNLSGQQWIDLVTILTNSMWTQLCQVRILKTKVEVETFLR